MKILHQLGHRAKWNLDAYFENDIGDGFIFTAYSFACDKLGEIISGYEKADYLPKSMLDLQYYGNKQSQGGKLETYRFHPINCDSDEGTCVYGPELIQKGIDFQRDLGFKNIIIPLTYANASDTDNSLKLISSINKKLAKKKDTKLKYFMTLPFNNESIINKSTVEKILSFATHQQIVFDGFYIVCDAKPQYKQKISTDYNYYNNLRRVFDTLKSQGFETIYGYANWDALIFTATTNIDYVSIGTYENLRSFNIKRFTESPSGGPSDGWYFSEKLLNVIKAQELVNLRDSHCLGLVANEKNIFSDAILAETYNWSIHRPDVHKNYLLSMSRLLNELAALKNLKERAQCLLDKTLTAKKLYARIVNEFNVYLMDESSDYHLTTWAALLQKFINS